MFLTNSVSAGMFIFQRIFNCADRGEGVCRCANTTNPSNVCPCVVGIPSFQNFFNKTHHRSWAVGVFFFDFTIFQYRLQSLSVLDTGDRIDNYSFPALYLVLRVYSITSGYHHRLCPSGCKGVDVFSFVNIGQDGVTCQRNPVALNAYFAQKCRHPDSKNRQKARSPDTICHCPSSFLRHSPCRGDQIWLCNGLQFHYAAYVVGGWPLHPTLVQTTSLAFSSNRFYKRFQYRKMDVCK